MNVCALPRVHLFRQYWLLRLVTPLALFALALPACALEAVTLQLKWLHQFQFAGYYAAQEKGFYRDAGLEVSIQEARPNTDPVAEVLSGRAQYGVGSSALLLARSQGKPVVILAVIYQHSPLVLLARRSAGIASVHDLAGKRVMLEAHSDELLAYLKHEGIAPQSLQVLPHSFNPDDLIDQRVDAMSAYSTDEAFFLDRAGIGFMEFSPRTGGIDFYGDNLFSSEAELNAHPARVRAFRQASLKGWKYAMEHPEEIADLIVARYGQRHGREYLRYEARQMRALLTPELVEMGYMYPGRWQHIANIYAEMGLLPANYSLDGLLYAEAIDSPYDTRPWVLAVSALLVGGVGLGGLALIFLRLYRRLKREISDRKEVSAVLASQQRDFRFITEHSADVIWTLDLASGRFTYISPSILRLRGYTVEEVMRQSVLETLTPESAAHAELFLAEAVTRWKAGDHGARVTEVDQPHKDGYVVHAEVVTTVHGDEDGNPAFMLGVTRDITERRKAEAFMRSLAFHDPLTMLPNRRLLLDRLQQAVFRARRDQTRVALMFLDLDEFKPINDRLGHSVGDWLLVQVASRMLSCVRESDTVARIGGDEFVVLLPAVELDADALAVAEKIRQVLNQPFITAAGEHLQISSSTGIVFYPDHGTNENLLLTHGDEAMYQAKEAGRNQVKVYRAAAPHKANGPATSLSWKPVYACGDAHIDADHRLLFELANTLMAAAERRQQEPEFFLRALDDLLQHTIMHFAHEESVLAELGYSELAEHVEEHRYLVARAKELQLAAQQGVLNITQLVDYLNRDVIAGHMIAEDLKFFDLFRKSN